MSLYRILLVVLSLLVAAFSQAASIAQRSPLAQGMWWDPARSGHGFEILNAGDQIGVAWFTYDENGRPIWYTAQGNLTSLGAQAWPLLQHRWNAEPAEVGSLRLDVHHPESADVIWELRGRKGTWKIQPFIVSGIVNEIDHSGVWFDPGNSGWGLTLTEQGDIQGGVLFTYDVSGEPVWAAGMEHGADGVEYFSFNGACPSCAYRAATSHSVGRLSFNFLNESEMMVRNLLSLPMAAGVKVDNARLVQLSRPASARAADRQLAHFDSESALKAYLDAGMMNIPAPSGITFSPGPAGTGFSTTNLQESGVDEADLVKSDGRTLYTYAYNNNVRQPLIRVAQSMEGTTLDILGTVALASGTGTPLARAGLFLYGNNLISIAGAQPISSSLVPSWAAPLSWSGGKTYIEILNTSNPDQLVTRWRAEIDGNLVTSRRIGQRLYVISRSVPGLPGFIFGSINPATVAANQQLLAITPLATLLPKVRINGGEASTAVAAQDVHAPPQGSQKALADMILVTAIDLDQPRIAQTLGIIGPLETVYTSTGNLFLASSRSGWLSLAGMLPLREPPFYLTDIHQIRLGADALNIVGSGSLEGQLGFNSDKAAFRLSEYEGRLRAVTSNNWMWGGQSANRLTILEPSTVAPGLLRTVSYLPSARRPEVLGKPGEELHSTRFVGDRLYAVTFKQVDPLYVVDLSNSADPRISGQLQLPGFSDYLHPLPNGLLLGFGKYARPADVNGDGQFGWFQGLQLSLFDVSNANQPREIQSVVIGKRGSDSALLRDHHAFSALMQPDGSGSFAIPARIHDGPVPQYGNGDSAYYPWAYSGLLRFELRGATPVEARLVQTPSLVTHSAQLNPINFNDPGSYDGRSVLFRNGAIYIGNGQFWRQDNLGNTFGPY